MGRSDEHSFEVYEIDTTYHQSFDFGQDDRGQPRAWFDNDDSFVSESGTSEWGWAYSWEGEPEAAAAGATAGLGRRFTLGPNADGAFYTHEWEGENSEAESEATITNWFEALTVLPVGMLRAASSTGRQYFPSYQWDVLGTIRQAGKSEDSIMVYHDVYPRDLTSENDDTPIIPDQMRKYLVYYALGRLFGRQGEGYDEAMSEHYKFRADRGVKIMSRIGRIERIDESYLRDGAHRGRREPPLPQLPSNYPRAPWLR
jgi:hypothetical protein